MTNGHLGSPCQWLSCGYDWKKNCMDSHLKSMPTCISWLPFLAVRTHMPEHTKQSTTHLSFLAKAVCCCKQLVKENHAGTMTEYEKAATKVASHREWSGVLFTWTQNALLAFVVAALLQEFWSESMAIQQPFNQMAIECVFVCIQINWNRRGRRTPVSIYMCMMQGSFWWLPTLFTFTLLT